MFKEFKEFINRGNVLELAVGVILAGAFGAVVTAFTSGVLMPPIGMALGGVDFSDLQVVLQAAELGADGEVVAEEVAIKWGAFVQTVIDFVIIAFVIFMVVKAYNNMKKKEEEAPAAPPAPSKEETLLSEIRDLLAKR